MGLDLRLLPFDADRYGLAFSHTILSCERRGDLFDSILEIEKRHGREVPEGFKSFIGLCAKCGDPHYGETTETPHGEWMKYVKAVNLLNVAHLEGVGDNDKNRAIWCYLAQLPGDTKVALYWH